MPIGHAHERAGIEAEEVYTLVLKLEALVSEDVFPGHATRVAPLGLVVAHHYIIRYAQPVDAPLHLHHGGTVTVVTDVSRDEHEVKTVQRVDSLDALSQLLLALGQFGVEMDIGQLGKTKVLGHSSAAQQHEGQKEFLSHFFHINLYANLRLGAVSPVVHSEMMSVRPEGLSAHLKSNDRLLAVMPSTLRGMASSITLPFTA